jgi:hypothetical protein
MASRAKEFADYLVDEGIVVTGFPIALAELLKARDADLTRLARAQAVSVLVERLQGKEFPLTPHDTAEACVTMCDIQEICRELLTPSDKDALAEKTSYEKLKAMMESEEGWIAPDKVAEHDRQVLTPPKELLEAYDEAVDKAESIGALKMLKNAEARLGRWLMKRLAELRAGKEPQP